MFCPSCGKKIVKVDRFCPHCGSGFMIMPLEGEEAKGKVEEVAEEAGERLRSLPGKRPRNPSRRPQRARKRALRKKRRRLPLRKRPPLSRRVLPRERRQSQLLPLNSPPRSPGKKDSLPGC